jgi:hypothetical protein
VLGPSGIHSKIYGTMKEYEMHKMQIIDKNYGFSGAFDRWRAMSTRGEATSAPRRN